MIAVLFAWVLLRFLPPSKAYDIVGAKFKVYFIDLLTCIFLVVFTITRTWNYIVNKFRKPFIKFLGKTEKEILTKKIEYGFFNPDLSLQELAEFQDKKLVDLDELGYSIFAKEIAKTISSLQTKKAFVIGINGAWGSGKSSLFGLMQEFLKNQMRDQEHLNSAPKIEIIEFSPWLYESSQSIFSEFFSLIRSRIHNPVADEEFGRYMQLLAKVENQIFKTDFLSEIKLDSKENKDIQTQKDILSGALKKSSDKHIVFVDDLDRLQKDEIPHILRLIKAVADLPNFIYVMAYDRPFLEHAIRDVITSYSSDRFLDKIVNIEFKLPEIDPKKKKDYLEDWVLAQLIKTKRIEEPYVKVGFEHAFKYENIDYYLETFRDLKRFSNVLFLRYMAIESSEVNFDHFFFLQLIDYKDSKITKLIYEKRNNIIALFDGPEKPVKDRNDILKSINNALGSVVDETAALLIYKMFKENHGRPISNYFHFQTYFSLQLFKENIRVSEIGSSISETANTQIKSLFDRNPSELLYKFKSWTESLQQEKLPSLFDSIFEKIIFLYPLYFGTNQRETLNWENYTLTVTLLIKKTDATEFDPWERIKSYATNSTFSNELLSNIILNHYMYEKSPKEFDDVISIHKIITDKLKVNSAEVVEVGKYISRAYNLAIQDTNNYFHRIELLRNNFLDNNSKYIQDNFNVLAIEHDNYAPKAVPKFFFPKALANYFIKAIDNTWDYFFSFYTKLRSKEVEVILDSNSYIITSDLDLFNRPDKYLGHMHGRNTNWHFDSSEIESIDIKNYYQLKKDFIELNENENFKRKLSHKPVNHQIKYLIENTFQLNYRHLEMLILPIEDFKPYLHLLIDNKPACWFQIMLTENEVKYKEHSPEEFEIYCQQTKCEDGFIRIYLDIEKAFASTFKTKDPTIQSYKIDFLKFRGFGKIATVRLYQDGFREI